MERERQRTLWSLAEFVVRELDEPPKARRRDALALRVGLERGHEEGWQRQPGRSAVRSGRRPSSLPHRIPIRLRSARLGLREQGQLRDVARLAPESPAQHARVAVERDHRLQRDLVPSVAPGVELAVGSL